MKVLNGVHYTSNCRNPSERQKEKVAVCNPEQFVCCFGTDSVISNSLNAEIEKNACPAVQKAVSTSEDPDMSWKTSEKDGTMSVVGCIELFSDKSQISLSTSSKKFFPLHMT